MERKQAESVISIFKIFKDFISSTLLALETRYSPVSSYATLDIIQSPLRLSTVAITVSPTLIRTVCDYLFVPGLNDNATLPCYL